MSSIPYINYEVTTVLCTSHSIVTVLLLVFRDCLVHYYIIIMSIDNVYLFFFCRCEGGYPLSAW